MHVNEESSEAVVCLICSKSARMEDLKEFERLDILECS